VDGGCFGR